MPTVKLNDIARFCGRHDGAVAKADDYAHDNITDQPGRTTFHTYEVFFLDGLALGSIYSVAQEHEDEFERRLDEADVRFSILTSVGYPHPDVEPHLFTEETDEG